MDSWCRVCSRSDDFRRFPLYAVAEVSQEVIANMLTNVTDTQVSSEDGLPQQICPDCLITLSLAYSFRKLCRRNDSKFRESFDIRALPLDARRSQSHLHDDNSYEIIPTIKEEVEIYEYECTTIPPSEEQWVIQNPRTIREGAMAIVHNSNQYFDDGDESGRGGGSSVMSIGPPHSDHSNTQPEAGESSGNVPKTGQKALAIQDKSGKRPRRHESLLSSPTPSTSDSRSQDGQSSWALDNLYGDEFVAHENSPLAVNTAQQRCEYCKKKMKKPYKHRNGKCLTTKFGKSQTQPRCVYCHMTFMRSSSIPNHLRNNCRAYRQVCKLRGIDDIGPMDDDTPSSTPTIDEPVPKKPVLAVRAPVLVKPLEQKLVPMDRSKFKSECLRCKVAFTSRAALVKHQRFCKVVYTPPVKAKIRVKPVTSLLATRKDVPLEQSRENRSAIVKPVVSSQKESQPPLPEKTTKCVYCTLQVSDKTRFLHHNGRCVIGRANSDHLCPKCPMAFATRNELLKHQREGCGRRAMEIDSDVSQSESLEKLHDTSSIRKWGQKKMIKEYPVKSMSTRQTPIRETKGSVPSAKEVPAKEIPEAESPTKEVTVKEAKSALLKLKNITVRKIPAKEVPATEANDTSSKEASPKEDPAQESSEKDAAAEASGTLLPVKPIPKGIRVKYTPSRLSTTVRESDEKTSSPTKGSAESENLSVEAEAKQSTSKETSSKQTTARDVATRQTPAKETPSKPTTTRETPSKLLPTREVTAKQSLAKQTPSKEVSPKPTPLKETRTRQSLARLSSASSQKDELSTPKSIVKRTMCRHCGQRIKESERDKHQDKRCVVSSLTKEQTSQYCCGYCWKTFAVRDHLIEHQKICNVRKLHKQAKCQFCGSIYSTRYGLKQHQRKTCKQNPKSESYQPDAVPKSEKKDKRESLKEKATRKETKPVKKISKPVKKLLKKKKFANSKLASSAQGVKATKKVVTDAKEKKPASSPGPAATTAKRHFCKYCKKQFNKLANAKKHALTCVESGWQKVYTCKYCKDKFPNKTVLYKHQRTVCPVATKQNKDVLNETVEKLLDTVAAKEASAKPEKVERPVKEQKPAVTKTGRRTSILATAAAEQPKKAEKKPRATETEDSTEAMEASKSSTKQRQENTSESAPEEHVQKKKKIVHLSEDIVDGKEDSNQNNVDRLQTEENQTQQSSSKVDQELTKKILQDKSTSESIAQEVDDKHSKKSTEKQTDDSRHTMNLQSEDESQPTDDDQTVELLILPDRPEDNQQQQNVEERQQPREVSTDKENLDKTVHPPQSEEKQPLDVDQIEEQMKEIHKTQSEKQTSDRNSHREEESEEDESMEDDQSLQQQPLEEKLLVDEQSSKGSQQHDSDENSAQAAASQGEPQDPLLDNNNAAAMTPDKRPEYDEGPHLPPTSVTIGYDPQTDDDSKSEDNADDLEDLDDVEEEEYEDISTEIIHPDRDEDMLSEQGEEILPERDVDMVSEQEEDSLMEQRPLAAYRPQPVPTNIHPIHALQQISENSRPQNDIILPCQSVEVLPVRIQEVAAPQPQTIILDRPEQISIGSSSVEQSECRPSELSTDVSPQHVLVVNPAAVVPSSVGFVQEEIIEAAQEPCE